MGGDEARRATENPGRAVRDCREQCGGSAAIEAGMDVPAADRRLAAVAIRDEGDDRLTNYRWRHTAASTLLMMGVDTLTVAELLGTSPEMIFRHYGHILDDHLATAASKLAGGRRKGSSRSS
jgi:integrase